VAQKGILWLSCKYRGSVSRLTGSVRDVEAHSEMWFILMLYDKAPNKESGSQSSKPALSKKYR
jgi:hypothetical protein